MTVFTLSWGTSVLGFSRQEFLLMQMTGILFCAVTIPLSALVAVKRGGRTMLIVAALSVIGAGLTFEPLFGAGSVVAVTGFLSLGLGVMGLTYGPLGTVLAELFPTAIRYTGASLTFNLAGIVGASLAPYVATWLASHYGLAHVGYYQSAAGLVTLAALLLIGKHARASS
jgi:MFS family permease